MYKAMTGIFQIFDRYKSKSYAKNDRRKSNSGESEIKAIPNYYLVEDDGVPKKVVHNQSDRQSRPESASRESRRPSSADSGEVVVKASLASGKDQGKRPVTDAQKSQQKEVGVAGNDYLSDAVTTPKPVTTAPSRDHRSRENHKLPPRSGGQKPSPHRDRASVKEVTDDVRDISRAFLQMREAAKSPDEGREARRHSPAVVRREFSGDDQQQHRRYQSSGDEKDRRSEVRWNSSVTEQYDDEKDHHRPQFPSEGKDYMRSWQSRTQPVKELQRYMSSGDELDRQSNFSSGDEHRFLSHHRTQESNRGFWPASEHAFRDESSGEERVPQRPPLSARRRHHQEERGQKYYSTRGSDGRRHESSGDDRRHTPGKDQHRRHSHTYRQHQIPAVELKEHSRYQSAGEDVIRHHASKAASRHHQQPSTSGYEPRRYQSSGDERGGRRVASTPVWLNESSEDDREVFMSRDARRSWNATDRRYSLGSDEAYLRQRDRIRSSVRGEAVRGHGGEWSYEDALPPVLVAAATPKECTHRRNSSVESSRGEHRRRSSNASERAAKEKDASSSYSRDLPPRSSRSHSSLQVSPRNAIDLARLNVQVRESSSSQTPALVRTEPQKSALDTSLLSPKSMTGSYDFREMLRQIDFKDTQWSSEKFGAGSSRNSADGRDPPRTSNVSRASVDSRQYQTSTPRLSVDGREHLRASSLHSSRASSVDAQVQLRTNSMDSSTSGEFKRRGPSVVARLMGLAELPEKDNVPATTTPSTKSLQKLLNAPPAEGASSQLHLSEVAQQMKQVAARLHQDSQMRQKSADQPRPKRKSKAKARMQSRSRSPPPPPPPLAAPLEKKEVGDHGGVFARQAEPGSSPLPRQPMSPKHHQMEGMPNVFKRRSEAAAASGDLDQRLHQLRIKNSIQEHRTLKQILEAMHLKGLLHPPQSQQQSPQQRKSPKSPSNHAAERPLHHDFFASKPSSSDVHYPEHFQDHSDVDQASIVVIKPVNYESGFEREKIEIGHRRRGSERSSGKGSRSHPLEPLEHPPVEKAPPEDLSFANVMLSWRERIAADAAKKATVEVADVQSRSKSAAKHRAHDVVNPLKYEKRSPRVQEEEGEFLISDGEGCEEEEKFNADRIPAQVAVLRSKRSSGKASRSKDKPSVRAKPVDEAHPLSPVKVAATPSVKDAEESARMTPKKRKIIVEPVVVVEEVLVAAAVPEAEEAVEGEDCAGELPVLDEPEDAKMEDAFDEKDTAEEAHTPEGFATSGRDKCFSEDGAFTLQGADHPSPVSVLDSPIFQEGFHLEELSTSPDSAKASMLRHDDESEDVLPREEPEAITPSKLATPDPLRDIYTKVVRSLELGEKDAYIESHQSPLSPLISGEDHSKGRLYVQGILLESGLTDLEFELPLDAAEIMDFDVFTRREEELQTAELERIDRGELEKSEERRYKESLDRRLVFDCMNEILERKMGPFLQEPVAWRAPQLRRRPCGERLVDEVWNELRDMHWPTSVAYDALYAVLQKDFMRKSFQWLDLNAEVADVGRELEAMIFLELVEECVHDLASIKPKPLQLACCGDDFEAAAPSSPSAPSEASSDDSERRRRELLDKTRRDLLAWHVQHQQI